jgi:hypothetical protein
MAFCFPANVEYSYTNQMPATIATIVGALFCSQASEKIGPSNLLSAFDAAPNQIPCS